MAKNGKIALFALAAGFVLCLAARTVGILCLTDMKTGFLLRESAFAYCLVYYGVCAAASVCAAAFAPKVAPRGFSPTGGGLYVLVWTAAFMAAFAALDGIQALGAPIVQIPQVIGDFIAAVYIIFVAVFTVLKKRITPVLGLLYAVIGGYFILRGIVGTSQRMALLPFQEYLLDILSTSLGAVFFVLFGKICSKSGEKRSMFFMRLWGSMTAILTLSSGFAAIIAKLFGGEEISSRITDNFAQAQIYFQQNALSPDGNYMMSFVPLVNMAMGVFAAVAVILSARSEKE